MTADLHDIVIVGGELIDGTGAPRRRANVAIDADAVTELTDEPLRGRQVIEADGRIVAPGFIDLHSHADFSLEASPSAASQLYQGVTTLVTGNCGLSPFPIRDRALFEAQSILGTERLSCEWTDAAGFATALERIGIAVNVALQVGHNSVRLAVLGMSDAAPTIDELADMRRLVQEAADHGVFGFSTGLIYAPGVFSDTAEIGALAELAGKNGMLYSTHMRNEADELLDAVREAISIAEHGRVRLEISHLKAMGRTNHGTLDLALELIDAAGRRGVDVAMDMYPYTATGTALASRLPAWSVAGGTRLLLDRLVDEVTRERIAEELTAWFSRNVDADSIVVTGVVDDASRYAVGRSLGQLAQDAGSEPADVALQLLAANEGQVGTVNHCLSERDLTAVLTHPRASVASDGATMEIAGSGPTHPRSLGSFARVLGRYTREQQLLTLEDAVRKMSGLPASRLGLIRRGVLRPGCAADVVVFDPAEVVDRATFDDPWQPALGISTVVVNGIVSVADGEPTENVGGRVLNRQRET